MVSNFGCFDECCEKKSVCGKFIVIKLANVAFFLYLCSRNRFKLHNTYQTIRNRSANHRDNKKITIMKILLLTVLQSLFALLGQKTMNTDFTITVQEHATQPVSYTGTLTMHGEQFILEAFGTTSSYDGKTLYSYNEDANELTLSTPTRDELYQANPLLFAQAMADACEVTEETRQGVTTLTFVPKERVAIDLITMVVKRMANGDKQYAPAMITIKEGLRTTKVQFRNLGYSDEVVDFVQHAEGAFVNDVR